MMLYRDLACFMMVCFDLFSFWDGRFCFDVTCFFFLVLILFCGEIKGRESSGDSEEVRGVWRCSILGLGDLMMDHLECWRG